MAENDEKKKGYYKTGIWMTIIGILLLIFSAVFQGGGIINLLGFVLTGGGVVVIFTNRQK
jgi:membrane-bound ClpP family serine protease